MIQIDAEQGKNGGENGLTEDNGMREWCRYEDATRRVAMKKHVMRTIPMKTDAMRSIDRLYRI
jgi:hypothetical protein